MYANNALAIVAEGVGWDVFTLFVGVPALVVSAVLAARGSFRGVLVTSGVLGYFGYLHLEYAVTWAFGPLFPLFVAILAATVVGLVGERHAACRWRRHRALQLRLPTPAVGRREPDDERPARRPVGRPHRRRPGDIAATLHGETTMTVQALDLGLLVPISVVIAVATLRRHPAGLAAGAAFAVTFVLLTAAIATMIVSSWIVTVEPAVAPIVTFGLAAVVGAFVTARIFDSARRAEHTAEAGPASLPVGVG